MKPEFKFFSSTGNMGRLCRHLLSEKPSDENIVQNINAKEQLESDWEEEVEEEPLPTAEGALMSSLHFSIKECFSITCKTEADKNYRLLTSKNTYYVQFFILI
ncbi:hypothetical protein HHI36_019836 [Cryptolaemus montrouzieri]|uniref:Uncharacterized protein n=1 Tax=Cryptolaemus montrouzieri TaxID=559131 RepID=A0ABD2N8X7_9CUCU